MKHSVIAAAAVAAMAAIASMPAAAQNASIDNAISSLARSNYVVRSTTSETTNDDGNSADYKIYYFSLPKGKKDVVLNIDKLFKQGRPESYFSEFQEKDDDNDKRMLVNLPDGSNLTVGKDDDYYSRVLCYKDPANNDYRYCYVLEWSDDDEEDDNGKPLYTGYVACVHSKRPTAKLGKTMVKLGDNRIVATSADGTTTVIGNGGITSYNSNGRTTLGDNINSNVDFMRMFGFYRQQIKQLSSQKGSETALNLYVTTMYKICNKEADKKRLNDEERNLCVKSLNELAGSLSDGFMSGMLSQAAKRLGGKK